MVVKRAVFVAAAWVLASRGANGQGVSQGINTGDTEAEVMRYDYAEVAVIARLRCDTAQAVERIGGQTGYVTYRVAGRVVEPFKGRVRRGQRLSYNSMAEASYPARFYRGDKIVFLNIIRSKGRWVYSALENSTHEATSRNVAAMRRMRDVANPAQQVRSFLRFHLAHEAGLNSQALWRRKAWLAPQLYVLLQREIKREAAFRAAHPQEVPFISGDIWTTSQDEVSSFRIATTTRHKDTATVRVRFRFGPAARLVSYRLRLRQGQWLIEDVVFDGESLLKILQRPSYTQA